MLIEISPVQRKPPRRFPVSQNLTTVRERIQAQGFCGLSDAMYAQINYPLRLSPAICMVWAAVGTALASPTILWALVPFAVLGAILPGHPFDVLYNYGLRHCGDYNRDGCMGFSNRNIDARLPARRIAGCTRFRTG